MKIRTVIAAMLTVLTLGTTVHADDSEARIPTLTVRGQAAIYKPADELSMSIGVVTQEKTAEVALKKNNEKMLRIIESVAIVGIKDHEYKTGHFSIRPIYSQRPKSPPPDWQAQIIGYEVTNNIGIKTDKIKLAGELIDNATQAGANSINSIRFGLKDPRMYRPDIIVAATQNAMTDAQTLSKAANVGIVKVLKISLDDAQVFSPVRKDRFYAEAMVAEGVPIEAGDVQINGSVTVVYEID